MPAGANMCTHILNHGGHSPSRRARDNQVRPHRNALHMIRIDRLLLLAAAFASAVFAVSALAQKLPPTSRNVFKCEVGGKVVYSDEPCLGAKRVDVEPTRGVDRATGSARVGADVQREKHNEQMAEALRPIFGEDAKQRATRHRRAALKPQDREQCYTLDREIATAEAADVQAQKAESPAAQANLLRLRRNYSSLQC